MSKILLTVAIPNYNGQPYLETAIRSCANLRLSRNEYEILVVDNASEDNSVQLLEHISSEFPNVRFVVNKKNIGRLPNWRKCIDEAKGEYLNFLFVTDEFHKQNNIHNLIRVLEQDESVSICVSTYIAEVHEGKRSVINKFVETDMKKNSLPFIKSRLMEGRLIYGTLQANLMRREDILPICFNKAYPFAADQIFCAEASLKRQYIYFNNSPGFTWKIYQNPNRFHANTLMEEIVENNLFVARVLADMVGMDPLKLSRFYASEIERVVRQKLRCAHLISSKSNFHRAIMYILHSAGDQKLSRLLILRHLCEKVFQKCKVIVERKIS